MPRAQVAEGIISKPRSVTSRCCSPRPHRHSLLKRAAAGGITVLCLLFSPSGPAVGEELPGQPKASDLLQQQIEEAKRHGVSFSPEQLQQLSIAAQRAEMQASRVREELSFASTTEGRSPRDNAGPKSHIRGTEGIPFPDPSEIVLRPVPTSAEPSPTPEPPWSPAPYTAPRKCEQNETKRVLFKEKESEEKEHRKDLLFVPEELVPDDYDEVFGAGVEVVPYTFPLTPPTLLRMELHSVPCVPYRTRMTNVAEYTDFGIHALKIYDGNPAGAGKLHPIIKQRLFAKEKPAKLPVVRKRR